MTTAAPVALRQMKRSLPPGTVGLLPGGLLARVRRACPTHGEEGACVGRRRAEGCLVFWCPEGHHHFTAR